MAGLLDELKFAGLKGQGALFALAGLAGVGIVVASKVVPGAPRAAAPAGVDAETIIRVVQAGASAATAALAPAGAIASAGLSAGARLGEAAVTSLGRAVETQSDALADVTRDAVRANAQVTIAAIDRLVAPPPPPRTAAPVTILAVPPPVVLGPSVGTTAPQAPAPASPPPAYELGRDARPLVEAIARGDIEREAVFVEPNPAARETQVRDAATGIVFDPAFGLFDVAKL